MNFGEWFLRGEWWPWLASVPLAWAILRWRERGRRCRTRALLGTRLAETGVRVATGGRWLGRNAAIGALLLGMLAVLQPSFGEIVENTDQRGVDLVICLDVSRSMQARDVTPDRMVAAQREIRALTERAKGDRFALVAFAGDARLVVPLTQDGDLFAGLVDRADSTSVARGGTDLGAALEVALSALRGRSGASEVVLLLTDGEDHEGRGLRLAERCRELGIAVHCLGFGSALGAKITLADERGESFLTDRSGVEVVSSMDRDSLRRLAESTGGEFVDARPGSRPLELLYEQRILPMARRAFESEQERRRRNDYAWPLLGALFLWWLESVVREGRR